MSMKQKKGEKGMEFALKRYKRINSRVKSLMRIISALVIVSLFIVFVSFSSVRASPDRILEPSFEEVTNWAFSETDNDYNGAQSITWATQGANSYLISIVGKNIGSGSHGQILQSVNFISIDTLSFDTYLEADTALEFEAQVLVGTAIVWSQAVPATATEYLHQEVDVSTYTTNQDLIFRIVDLLGAKSATINCYFDNIKIWGSYSDAERTIVCTDFTTSGDYVYMYGENFDITGTYKVAYYDGGTAHDGADGLEKETDTYTGLSGGILNSACRPSDYGTSSHGTWHAVVYKTTEPMPNSYNLVSKTNDYYAVTDSFSVQQGAIPEFPTVIAAIAVCMLCAVAYVVMRRRAGER